MIEIKYETRTMETIVVPKRFPANSEFTTYVRIIDDDGCEVVEVEQKAHVDLGKIAISPGEWPFLRAAIDRMIGECRPGSGDEQ